MNKLEITIARLNKAISKLGGVWDNGEWHKWGCNHTQCKYICNEVQALLIPIEEQVNEAIKFFMNYPKGEHYAEKFLNIYGECKCDGCRRLQLALGERNR